MENAVRDFLNNDTYKHFSRNYFNPSFCIRIEDEVALSQDLTEREKLFAFCDKNRISIIMAGSDDYHFYNLCKNRAYFIYFDYIIASWDEVRLEIEPT